MSRTIQRYKTLIVMLLMVVLLVAIITLSIRIKEVDSKLKELELDRAFEYAQRIEFAILQKTDNLKPDLLHDEAYHEEISLMLRTFLTREFRYIYVLNKDNSGIFRILYDGEDKANRAELGEPFFAESEVFEKVFSSGKATLIAIEKRHHDAGIWRTLIYPIKRDGKVRALLVLELSKEYMQVIEALSDPIESVVYLLWWLLSGIALVTLVFMLMYAWWFRRYYIDRSTGLKNTRYLHDFAHFSDLRFRTAYMISIEHAHQLESSKQAHHYDELMKHFAQMLRGVLPGGTLLTQTGKGEFFALSTPEENTHQHRQATIERIEEELRNFRIKYRRLDIDMRMFVSVARFPDMKYEIDIATMQKLLDEKMALLRTSMDGVSVKFFEDINDELLRQSNYEFAKSLLDQEAIVCLYQPIVDIQKCAVQKYEALVRFIDPDEPGRLISPFRILQAIKGTTQYTKLTRLVLKSVLETLKQHDQLHISVNLDLSDVLNPFLMKEVLKFLDKHRKEALRLTIEFTEDQQIVDFESVKRVLESIRKYGTKIALDDFGSGYAGHRYIVEIDWDVLKIDGSLVRKLDIKGSKSHDVIRSIVHVAENNGIDVVAEFVENETLVCALRNLGVRYAQGYHFAKPDRLESFLKDGRFQDMIMQQCLRCA